MKEELGLDRRPDHVRSFHRNRRPLSAYDECARAQSAAPRQRVPAVVGNKSGQHPLGVLARYGGLEAGPSA
jgi:hypothetical protein